LILVEGIGIRNEMRDLERQLCFLRFHVREEDPAHLGVPPRARRRAAVGGGAEGAQMEVVDSGCGD